MRRGVLKFRGWERRASSLKPGAPSVALTDADFQAKWEQKGVDLRIGLDIVTMTESRAADLIVLLTGDTEAGARSRAPTRRTGPAEPQDHS